MPTLHNTTFTEMTPPFGSAKFVLQEMTKAITPWRGLASFISFPGQIGFTGQVRQHLPFAEPASNRFLIGTFDLKGVHLFSCLKNSAFEWVVDFNLENLEIFVPRLKKYNSFVINTI